jgi:hypothetical protein
MSPVRTVTYVAGCSGVRGSDFGEKPQLPNPLTLARFAHSTSPLWGEVKDGARDKPGHDEVVWPA